MINIRCLFAQDYKFVEVRVNSLQAGVRLAVVSRLKRETVGVSKRSLRVCSSVDPRISFAFNAANLATKKPVNFTLEVLNIRIEIY
jgi:hypothetical protein